MAWTDPTTRSVGDLITSSIWNTDLVNNLVYLHGGLPSCRVYNSANIAIASSTLTALTFNAERYDTDAIHDTGVNPSRLTCKTAGKYAIWAHCEIATSIDCQFYIRLNGATVIAEFDNAAPSPAAQSFSTPYDLAVNDYVEFCVLQASGGSVNVNAAGNYSPEFAMHRIG
jgi:hypothetical protein